MQRKRFYATQLMKLCFQALLYASLFVSFFGMLSITNEAILNISRTAGTTIATFVLTMLLLSVVYGGYEIGVKKMRSVFASISLATFFTDLITYVMLQIMNTNPNNPDANPSFTFWGEDLALLFGAFILQLLMIYLFVALGYRYYFRINPPLDCCIVASSQELAEHVASKMATFRQRYRLTDVVHYECPDVKQTIQDHDVVFLAGIPDTEEALLEAYCYKHNKTIYLLAELEDVVISTAQQNILDDAPFLFIHRMELTLTQRFLKRACDIVIRDVYKRQIPATWAMFPPPSRTWPIPVWAIPSPTRRARRTSPCPAIARSRRWCSAASTPPAARITTTCATRWRSCA